MKSLHHHLSPPLGRLLLLCTFLAVNIGILLQPCDAFLSHRPCRVPSPPKRSSTRSPTSRGDALIISSTSSPPSVPSRKQDNNNNLDDAQDEEEEEEADNIRPLYQNWWPVATEASLDPSRPNALQVLGMKLVAVYDPASASWKVLQDKCSHRFAPLSEGRVVLTTMGDSDSTKQACLQCAYHGWEFQATDGVCVRLPQQNDKVSKAKAVATFPVRQEIGILWVWTDPTSSSSSSSSVALANKIPLPLSPLVKQHVQERGLSSCYMRDLPYGMELLGENLLDLSHLPFSHHSVGTLNRALGGDLPTRMLSKEERIRHAAWEKDEHSDGESSLHHQPVLPRYQAEILQASKHDPILASFPQVGNTTAWTTTIGFYDPCHVRYRRCRGPGSDSHVELFFCPTSPGRSRVFLFNVFRTPPPPPLTKVQKVTRLIKPSFWKGLVRVMAVKALMGGANGHLFTHLIFDGDGIFLHKQGNRMKEAGLSFRDYCTPSSADILLNAYRRFLDTAAQTTRNDPRYDAVAEAAVGQDEYGNNDLPRSVMLDRFNTHTKHCPLCRNALQKTRRQKSRVAVLKTALQGAAGASATTLAVLVALQKMARVSLARGVWPIVLASTASTIFGSMAAGKLEEKLSRRIDKFLFEDYVHAEKD